MVRAGLRAMLEREPGFRVLGEAENGNEAAWLAEALRPDVLIVDLGMPGLSGTEVTTILGRRASSVRVLVLTMHDDPGRVKEALEAGALGYITKRCAESELVKAVHAVARGEQYVQYSQPAGNGSEQST